MVAVHDGLLLLFPLQVLNDGLDHEVVDGAVPLLTELPQAIQHVPVGLLLWDLDGDLVSQCPWCHVYLPLTRMLHVQAEAVQYRR